VKDAALPTALGLSNIMSGMLAQGNNEIFWLDARPVIVTTFHATFVDALDIEEAQGDFLPMRLMFHDTVKEDALQR
jgi:hypothetical protein